MAGEQRAEGLDHVGSGEQPPVPGDQLQEIRGQPLDLHLFEDGGDGAHLLLGGKDRAPHQAAKVLDGVERLIEAVQILLDALKRVFLERELEQGIGIAARNA